MIKRTISGIILSIILISVLVIPYPIAINILLLLISFFGIIEFYKAFKNVNIRPIELFGYASCASLLFVGIGIAKETIYEITKYVIPITLILIFCYMIFAKKKRNIIDVAVTCFGILYIPLMLAFVKLITLLDKPETFVNEGIILLLYGAIGAFATDVFAYLIGRKFGKNKLCPDISPNKTVEGSIGGLIGTIIVTITYTLIINYIFKTNYNIYYSVLVGIISSIAGQLGDLTASAIKRYTKIKDFGKLIPGHGGILDRFDSIIFVMPVIYLLLK